MSGKMKKPVLIIDDEEAIRELVCDSLELDDISVDSAKDFQEAYESLEKNCYEVVLIDRNLGNCFAEDIIGKLKSRCLMETIFVLMTGDRIDDEMLWKNQGFDYIMYKPFEIDNFNEFVTKILES